MQVSTCWTDALAYGPSLHVLATLAQKLCKRNPSRLSKLSQLIEKRRWKDVLAQELKAETFACSEEFANARQVQNLFKKLEFLEIGVDKRLNGLLKFYQAEAKCAESNDLFRGLTVGTASLSSRSVHNKLSVARNHIRRVLGKAPTLATLGLRLGPGATTSVKKVDAAPCFKFASGLQCSRDLLASGLLPELLRELPHLCDALGATESRLEIGLVSGPEGSDTLEAWISDVYSVELHHGRLSFVPKNAVTERGIDEQPSLNMMFQLALGDSMSNRLRLSGLNLRSTAFNRSSARKGSVDGSTATIDLESASDTISYWLVKYLLPADWFSLLNAARCSTTTWKGEVIQLKKFSAMGNGFTFPLESLIFWALTLAVSEHTQDVNVYGDDIVCHASDYESVKDILQICGFTVNTTKSFSSGPFRESCGGDYFMGSNVRSCYPKHLVSGESLFVMHNHFWRKSDLEMCEAIKEFIPVELRLYGPDGYGDGHLCSHTWPVVHRKQFDGRGYSGGFFHTYSLEGRSVISPYPGDHVSPLYAIYQKALVSMFQDYDIVQRADDPVDTSPQLILKHGRPVWSLPGTVDGSVKRRLVYTFDVPL